MSSYHTALHVPAKQAKAQLFVPVTNMFCMADVLGGTGCANRLSATKFARVTRSPLHISMNHCKESSLAWITDTHMSTGFLSIGSYRDS